MTTAPGNLEVVGIRVQYGGISALDGVSFLVREGETTGLIGPNGSGKTTMLNVISGWRRPAAGQVKLDDEPLVSSPEATARSGIIRTFQTIRLFDEFSALEHQALAEPALERGGLLRASVRTRRSSSWKSALERGRERLAEVGLPERYWELPVGELSYGNRRLAEIARALVRQPRFLLLDEPTAGMNASESQRLGVLLQKVVAAGTGILLVEHNLPIVRSLCERIIVLDRGHKIADGEAGDVFDDESVQRAYLGAPASSALPHAPLIRPAVSPGNPQRPAALGVSDLTVSYGGIAAAEEVCLHVGRGEIVGLLGPNGAGKTSSIFGIAGLVRSSGNISIADREVSGMAAHLRAAAGLAIVPEGRRIFGPLTVLENLEVAYRGAQPAQRFEELFDLFPILGQRRLQQAGTLSGGEQQMLAIARALAQNPTVMLIDEPSMGLAPLIVDSIYETLLQLGRTGSVGILVADQNVRKLLETCTRGYVMDRGRIVDSWDAATVSEERLAEMVLGGEPGGTRAFGLDDESGSIAEEA